MVLLSPLLQGCRTFPQSWLLQRKHLLMMLGAHERAPQRACPRIAPDGCMSARQPVIYNTPTDYLTRSARSHSSYSLLSLVLCTSRRAFYEATVPRPMPWPITPFRAPPSHGPQRALCVFPCLQPGLTLYKSDAQPFGTASRVAHFDYAHYERLGEIGGSLPPRIAVSLL